MPVHDWSLVDAGSFHDFHTLRAVFLRNALNAGRLPDGYFAMTAPPSRRTLRRTITIRHISGKRIVALVEIASPANKDRAKSVRDFAAKVEGALRLGVHVVLVDLLPPGKHDPRGLHGAIWKLFDPAKTSKLPNGTLTLASYVGAPKFDAYLHFLKVGEKMLEMPLFLRPDRYVSMPLESTYEVAYREVPPFVRAVLERDATDA